MGYERSTYELDSNHLSYSHYISKISTPTVIRLWHHQGQELWGSESYQVPRTRPKALVGNNFLLKTVKATLILHCQQQISCYKGFVAVGQLCTSAVLTPDEPPSPTTRRFSQGSSCVTETQ